MKTQEVKVVILEADPSMELFNISNPSIYAKRISLGVNDSPENWAERPETIVELNQVTEPVEGPTSEI